MTLLVRWLCRNLVVFDIDHLVTRRKLARNTNCKIVIFAEMVNMYVNKVTAVCFVQMKPVHMFILVKEAIKGHIFESDRTIKAVVVQ